MTDKVVVVVGAGQTEGETIGNGRAIAIRLAQEGATVLAVDRDLTSAEETVSMLRGEVDGPHGAAAEVWRADITDEDDCRSIADHAMELFGRIDGLVNNVGIGVGDGGPSSVMAEAWDRIHEVNLKGMWLTCKYVYPLMKAQQSGAIVNISSVAAVCSAPLLAYKTSKAGVNALTQSLAMAGARHGVRVNAVMPGLMDTPMAVAGIAQASGQEQQAVRDARNARVPLGGKMGDAWDIAHAVLFLASDEARYITATEILVDGGLTAASGLG
jgi:NAD(P)-dependent dehydrogenase (short-subunit alcohol dehydrogenase family)